MSAQCLPFLRSAIYNKWISLSRSLTLCWILRSCTPGRQRGKEYRGRRRQLIHPWTAPSPYPSSGRWSPGGAPPPPITDGPLWISLSASRSCSISRPLALAHTVCGQTADGIGSQSLESISHLVYLLILQKRNGSQTENPGRACVADNGLWWRGKRN